MNQPFVQLGDANTRTPRSLALRIAPLRPASLLGVALAVAAGAALRLCLPTDIEWKGDEVWTFTQAHQMAATGVWPPVGMPSSAGPPNPGLSLWIFTGLFELFGVRSPPGLARAVQLLNVLALALFAAFAWIAVPQRRREPWLWALALWAVNPISVILERKIWPPSVLPLASVALIWAWWGRRHPAAAFAWGALGALMSQVHLGVAFLAFALAAWTLAADRGAFPWRSWLAGSVAGALPAIPWALTMLAHGAGGHFHLHPPGASFYLRWVSQYFGWGAQYALGREAFRAYLDGPVFGGVATHLMGAAQIVLVLAAAIVLFRGVGMAWRPGRPTPRAILLGDSPETQLIAAALWGYGGLLTLITLLGPSSNRHYLIVVTPMLTLWTAMTVLWGFGHAARNRARILLATICVLQAAMSAGLLAYIHQQGVIPGEFGASWRAQRQPGYVAAPAPDHTQPDAQPAAR